MTPNQPELPQTRERVVAACYIFRVMSQALRKSVNLEPTRPAGPIQAPLHLEACPPQPAPFLLVLNSVVTFVPPLST